MKEELIKESIAAGFLSKDNINTDYYHLWMFELQKWLRKKGVGVFVNPTLVQSGEKQGIRYTWYIASLDMSFNDSQTYSKEPLGYLTYEEGLSEGLNEGLKLVQKKKGGCYSLPFYI